LLFPRRGSGFGERYLGRGDLDGGIDERFPVGEVAVERHRAHAKVSGQPAHGQPAGIVRVQKR
jgi:hypothetical protein